MTSRSGPIPPGPRTVAGRALGSFIHPRYRNSWFGTVSDIEDQAARAALTELRARVADLPDPCNRHAVLSLIDEAIPGDWRAR